VPSLASSRARSCLSRRSFAHKVGTRTTVDPRLHRARTLVFARASSALTWANRAQRFLSFTIARARRRRATVWGSRSRVSSRVLTRRPRDSVRERTRDADPPRAPRECAPRVEPVASVARDRARPSRGSSSRPCARVQSPRARVDRTRRVVMSTLSTSAMASRVSRASRAGSSGRVHIARARDGRHRSIVCRADGSGGRGRGDGKAQDVDEREGMDWDGAWNAFKRDFVGDDAKMPNDYVETRFQSKRYASSRVSSVIDRVRRDASRDERLTPSRSSLALTQTRPRRRRETTNLRRRGPRLERRDVSKGHRGQSRRRRRALVPLYRRHRSASERRTMHAALVRVTGNWQFNVIHPGAHPRASLPSSSARDAPRRARDVVFALSRLDRASASRRAPRARRRASRSVRIF